MEMTLENVLQYLKNWFIVPRGVHHGKFKVENGYVLLPFLQNGQYFRIIGSVFNDGLHRYGPEMEAMQDEVFDGTVWALAVPQAVIKLSTEIEKWQKEYGEKVTNPFTSESFGPYSYTKSSGADGSGGSWQAAFSSQLAQWRKI